MIPGLIREDGTPIVTVRVVGTRGREATVEGILDTGFDGFLCLPIPIAVSLGLELLDVTDTELADGTVVENDLIFLGAVEWDGIVMEIEVMLTRSDDALIGTAFPAGYVAQLDYQAHTVRIERASA